jgi:hypothetical protein
MGKGLRGGRKLLAQALTARLGLEAFACHPFLGCKGRAATGGKDRKPLADLTTIFAFPLSPSVQQAPRPADVLAHALRQPCAFLLNAPVERPHE